MATIQTFRTRGPTRALGGLLLVVGIGTSLAKPFADPGSDYSWFAMICSFVFGFSLAANGWTKISQRLTLGPAGIVVLSFLHRHQVPWERLKPVRRDDLTLVLSWDREMFLKAGPFPEAKELQTVMTTRRHEADQSGISGSEIAQSEIAESEIAESGFAESGFAESGIAESGVVAESTRELRWSSVALAGSLLIILLAATTLGHRWDSSFW